METAGSHALVKLDARMNGFVNAEAQSRRGIQIKLPFTDNVCISRHARSAAAGPHRYRRIDNKPCRRFVNAEAQSRREM
jgi:hypothetical protein